MSTAAQIYGQSQSPISAIRVYARRENPVAVIGTMRSYIAIAEDGSFSYFNTCNQMVGKHFNYKWYPSGNFNQKNLENYQLLSHSNWPIQIRR